MEMDKIIIILLSQCQCNVKIHLNILIFATRTKLFQLKQTQIERPEISLTKIPFTINDDDDLSYVYGPSVVDGSSSLSKRSESKTFPRFIKYY